MIEKAFKFSGKDLIKLSIMLVMATLLFGLPGLIIMLLLQWLTSRSYALDSPEKHGISQVSASRLGGAAIFASVFVFYAFGIYLEILELDNFSSESVIIWFSVSCCMIIGLIDDLKSNLLSPKVRLISISLVFIFCLAMVPVLIPKKIGLVGLDFMLNNMIFGWLLTVVFCVGFVNAINMSDGANGLVPGTITIAFSVFYMESGSSSFAIMMAVCGLFTIFNLISGKLFLGDAGAYGLGAVLALNGLFLFSQGLFSAAFLAVLFAYPCIDILITVSRRLLKARSVFLPDNDHLHNRIHFHCQRWFKSKTLANSLTGVLIVSCSAGLAMLGYTGEWWSVMSNQWAWIFLCQVIMYLFAFLLAGHNRPFSQYVAD